MHTPEELIGRQIEHYRIEGIVGKGGMGTVYRALDINLARPVAIKVMHAPYSRQVEFQQRFQQEAQASARLDHPSIVRVYHFGREQGLLYLVMELVPGLSLGSYMRQLAERDQIIRLDETMLLIAQVADALGYAHHKGVIHRDVKPDNMIVKQLNHAERPDEPPLRAVMTDFGLAKLMEGGMETKTGEFLGTLAYVSPEQITDGAVDGRSDIYSLGVVLFQLATGHLPFRVRTPSEALDKHGQQPPPMPHVLQPGFPLPLEEIILKALAKKPEDRYQAVSEMAEALRQVAAGLPDGEVAVAPGVSHSSVVSMVFEIDSNANLANTSRWIGEKQVQPPGYDRLLINREGEDPEIYVLYKDRFAIGRSEGNDIVLVGANVSRYHARLEHKDGWWHIADTESTNGTYLNRAKLAHDADVPWPEGQIARVGPFYLELELAVSVPIPLYPAYQPPPLPVQAVAVASQLPAPAAVPSSPPLLEHIAADIKPNQLKGPGICRVLLLNKGGMRSTITVSANDPQNRLRFDATTKQITLAAGQKGVVDFYLEPRKRPWIGRRQRVPYNLFVSTSQRDWGTYSGELISRPVLGILLIILLIVLFIMMLAAIVYGVRFLPEALRAANL